LELQDGTKSPKKILLISVLSALVATAPTCRTSQESSTSSEDSTNETPEDADSGVISTADTEFPHPRTATAWDTNALVLTETLPPAQELTDCEREVTALAKDATNDTTILLVEKTLQKTVSANVKLYHWCFYWMVRNLDVRTEAFGLTIDERSVLFFQGMRSLWGLARALDQNRQVELYFQYIRRRYVDMSAAIFGRPLEIISEPLGDKDGPPRMVRPGKPAGSSDAE
jgi:hypothetical protein